MASRVGDHPSDDTPLADAGLVANNKAFALLDVRDPEAKRVYLFCREVTPELIDRATKATGDVPVNITVLPFESVEAVERRISEICREERIKLDADLGRWFVGGLTLYDLSL